MEVRKWSGWVGGRGLMVGKPNSFSPFPPPSSYLPPSLSPPFLFISSTYLRTYLRTYLPTYLCLYLPTYLPTYLPYLIDMYHIALRLLYFFFILSYSNFKTSLINHIEAIPFVPLVDDNLSGFDRHLRKK